MSITTLKREVTEIKQRVNPAPKHIIIPYFFCHTDEPHGCYQGTITHMITDQHNTTTRWQEAIDTETEIAAHQAFYDKNLKTEFGLRPFMKESTHPYSTFEKFLASQLCTCGKHGVDGKQPYLGERS